MAPELKNKNVFVKGSPEVCIVSITSGGQTPPMLYTGAKLE